MHMMRRRPRNARGWPLCSFFFPPRLECPRVLERTTAPLSRPRARPRGLTARSDSEPRSPPFFSTIDETSALSEAPGLHVRGTPCN